MESGNLESGPSTPAESDEPPIVPQQSPQQQGLAKPESNICRKNIWGICEKLPSQCRFEHSRDPQIMKDVLKFCHDFQNQGCTRPNCTYIHSSKDEQTAFLKNGEIPPFLVLRYNALEGRLKAKYGPNAFGPQTPMTVVEPTVQPPLPPPLPLEILQSRIPPPPPPTTPPPIPHPPPPQAIIGPQPQSLTVQQYVSPTNMGVNNSTFSKPQYPVNAVPILPLYHVSSNNSQQLRFDASRPPPPLPQNNSSQAIAVCANSPSNDLIPSKRRCLKPSIPVSSTSHSESATTPAADVCVSCLEREISIKELIVKMDKLSTAEVEDKKHYQILIDNYEKTKKIIFSAMGPEQRLLVEEYLESTARDPGYSPNRWLPYSVSSPLNDETKPNNAFICNLLEIIVSSNNNRTSPEVGNFLMHIQDEEILYLETEMDTLYNHYPQLLKLNSLGTLLQLDRLVFKNKESTNMFETSTLLQNLSQLSRRPTQTPQVQDMSQLLQQFIAHCGQTFLLNQITASRTTNVAGTSGIVNSRNNHIMDITTSPRQITNQSHNSTTTQAVAVATNQTETVLPPLYDPNKPPPNMGFFSQTPTTSPGTITRGTSVHSAQMYQNIMTTRQVGVNVYGSTVPVGSQQQQPPLPGQQTFMPDQFPLGPTYYNPYHQ